MPFKKGHTPHNKGQKRTEDETSFESVMDETLQSASPEDEIVPKQPPLPEPAEKDGTVPQIPTTDDPDFAGIHGWNMAELEFMDVSLNRVPKPPKCVQRWCEARELKWRWMSYPRVKHYGMRGYVALSITPELRKKIKAGDCPAAVDIDVSNKLVWREDAFLGVIPLRMYNARKAAMRQRTIDQTKLANAAPDGLKELAARAGGKVGFTVEQTVRQGM